MAVATDYVRGTINDIMMNEGWDRRDQKVVQMFARKSRILQDMEMVKCNNSTLHRSFVQTSLPKVAWRMLNRGTEASKGGKKEVTFTCGALETLSQVDEKELIYGEPNSESNSQYRLDESVNHQMAMANEMGTTMFYGDEKINPAGFTGLGAYYYSMDKAKCSAYEYVIDAGGTGSNLTSMYLVVWGTHSIHGIYPEGTKAGFQFRDNGRTKIQDTPTTSYYGYESQFNWDLGLAVRNYKYGVRIANIDVKNPNEKLLDSLIEAYNRIEDFDGRAFIYANRSAVTIMDKLASNKNNLCLSVDDYHGQPTTQFWKIPVRREDGILSTEERVI